MKNLFDKFINLSIDAIHRSIVAYRERKPYGNAKELDLSEFTLTFEDHFDGDNVKVARAFEGSMDLYSRKRNGDGWVQLIEQTLTAHCGCNWILNYHGYEREAALSHWEWAFQVEG